MCCLHIYFCFINIPFALCLPSKLSLCCRWRRHPKQPQCCFFFFSSLLSCLPLKRTWNYKIEMIGRRGDNRCEKMRRFCSRNSEMTSLTSTVARFSAARGRADVEQRETKRMQRTKAEIECKKKIKKRKKKTRELVGKMLQR